MLRLILGAGLGLEKNEGFRRRIIYSFREKGKE